MTSEGIVVCGDEHYVTVAIKQQTACDGCHKKDGCVSCASLLEVKAHNNCGAGIGDRVEVTTSTCRVLLYALVVFVLPFVPAAAAYAAVHFVFHRLFLSVGAAVCALVLFYLFVRLTLDRKAEKRCDRSASKILSKAAQRQKDDR